MSTTDKFWEIHAQEMRKARLLQAAAVLHGYASLEPAAINQSVKVAFALERGVERELELNGHSEKAVSRQS